MKKSIPISAWQQYEAGRDHKRKIGLYETVRTNERFYRGEQWQGGGDLPKPVFNIVRRISDYLICNVASTDLTITYTDDTLPFISDKNEVKMLSEGLEALSENAAYRWERGKLRSLIYKILNDAAISGDGALYCWWDPKYGGTKWGGDIITEAIDNVNIFVSDVNRADIQSQQYIILSGRASVSSLRNEARDNGASESDIAKIVPDGQAVSDVNAGDIAMYELNDSESEKTTFILKFWRENGKVVFEKSTRNCIIRRAQTPCLLYPVAFFNWYPTKNSFHGTSPISGLIPNQKFINRAYAMAMKHMTDAAFSKIIYDRTRIPEWTNEVGEAIGAMGGGNIADSVAVVGTGKLEEGYLDLISNTVLTTKELAGATETALGNTSPTNTSAILALQEGAEQSLSIVRTSLYQCIEDMALIWADMICAYYPETRLLRTPKGSARVNYNVLRNAFIRAGVNVSESASYSLSGTQSLLEKMLEGGYITFEQFLERVPNGLIPHRNELINAERARREADAQTQII